jgi:hypothetical protein
VDERVQRLRVTLKRLAVLLEEHAEPHWASWARGSAQAISLKDPDSFKLVTGAYGGMGSLSDVALWPESGRLTPGYPAAVEFQQLRAEAYSLAAQILADLRAEAQDPASPGTPPPSVFPPPAAP